MFCNSLRDVVCLQEIFKVKNGKLANTRYYSHYSWTNEDDGTLQMLESPDFQVRRDVE